MDTARQNYPSVHGHAGKAAGRKYTDSLDFTYGVIDKCILKALLGEDSLIL